ncbi:hypothetical protein [Brevibacterium sp. FAM 24630]|uniref:hypothetical protein n=1 Tax=Brevibacterium sp. FAM 24630 TaxID=3415680 RepID=UPI003C7D3CF9
MSTPKKCIDLLPTMLAEMPAYETDIRRVLKWLDENPDQVPGRTITESELGEVVRTHESIRDLVGMLGFTIVEDSEPTTSQHIFADLDELNGDGFLIRDRHKEKIAHHLADLGWVKAPEAGGDDE